MRTRLPFNKLYRHIVCLLLLAIPGLAAFAQPSYTFTGAVLESGTDLQVGAVYRFSNVKPGVDALVTITIITPNATVTKIDNDGGAGYVDAFQPEIMVSQYSSGYAQFHIDFVASGTSTLLTMTDIPATAVDIDGNNAMYGGSMNEFDGISMGASSFADYEFLGDLTVTHSPGWVQALNTGGIEYTGITTTSTAVMLTVVNQSATSFDYRTGVNNNSAVNDLSRQKSLYFMRFTYPNSVLSQRSLRNFNGTRHNNTTRLNWQLQTTGAQAQQVVLEKSIDGIQFTSLKTYQTNNGTHTPAQYQYVDANTTYAAKLYYRLKITGVNGTEYSRLLQFNNTSTQPALLNISPTVIRSTATINIVAEQSGTANLYVYALGGQLAVKKQLTVQEGTNSLLLNIDASLAPGMYVVQVVVNGKTASKKIIIER